MQNQAQNLLNHEYWMHRALELAGRSAGMASPNPAVGCVLVKDGVVVGEGFHQYEQRDHAEVVALKSAGEAARGAAAYVTLEPCSHTGRTGPCSQALIAAGVTRVIVATADPNPAVNGQGIDQLRQAGIAVETGVLENEARRLNDGFAQYIRTGLPFVNLKAAVSLDGRIAPAPGTAPQGAPVYLTGGSSRAAVQRMRHSADAVITGINTVLHDDPQLTDRSGLPRRRPLLRVILDSALRMPLDAKLVRTAQQDVLIFCTISPTQRQQALEAMGVQVERVEPGDAAPEVPAAGWPAGVRRGGVALDQVLARLGEMSLLSVMLEAGGQLNSSALAGDYVDKLTLFYAPVFLGPGGVPLLQAQIGMRSLSRPPSVATVGQDVRVDAYLRDPWV